MMSLQKPQVNNICFLIYLEGTQTPEIKKGAMKINKRSYSHTLNILDPFGSLKHWIPEDPEYGKDTNNKDISKVNLKSQTHLLINKPKTAQKSRKMLKFFKQKVDYLK